ncbi:hypothetical protein [Pedobacter sp. Leaf216]|uniref:hypothetical protein n=1 Tax=Pedobacter sp. Leaf216 TaxID=1735684 RepID=UPI001F479F8F|nr:hypothetical protein [Pedobacter sp. Leaf216]
MYDSPLVYISVKVITCSGPTGRTDLSISHSYQGAAGFSIRCTQGFRPDLLAIHSTRR